MVRLITHQGALNISDEVTMSTNQSKLISLPRNITQTASGQVIDAIGKTYPSDKQYLAFPETKAGR